MENHSVTLNVEKCRGCTTCLHNCPTHAIRVRDGKAVILNDYCIDCGECIRVCPHGAKGVKSNYKKIIDNYKYKIALVPPTLMGQVSKLVDQNQVLTAIKNLGFDDAFEVAFGAEIVGKALKYEISKSPERLHISSACPAVVKLITERFPLLIDNIIPLKAPITVSGEYIRKEIIKGRDIEDKDIGVFFISPCAAKITDIEYDLSNKDVINGAIPFNQIFADFKKNLTKYEEEPLHKASTRGLKWAVSGGESDFLDPELCIHVDGIKNVLNALEEIDRGKMDSVIFFEGLACTGGCVGGCLTIENPYVAKKRILTKVDSEKDTNADVIEEEEVYNMYASGSLHRSEEFKPIPIKPLDDNVLKAIEKMNQIDKITKRLPGLDCGSCGCPGCRKLAEDIVRGNANEMDCIFILKDAITKLSGDILRISQKVVPIMEEKGNE